MNRIFFIVVAAIVVIGIGVTVWIAQNPADARTSVAPVAVAPLQFDTTGGQEMRPRWDNGEEQGNDAAEN
ncbi:hypothetical protein [Aerobium aerolatum]|uniref:Entry exclusion protein TrbK, Ti-type n=1 Tax=Aquamicrobium aerolatum DSM 21857 TaxID=1121003 RepID=A0A1I3RBZ3_9HYPH|nr:hypothetical protein [Aquamicrobium aerolatum]SFJ42716.1 hypothetical protein SAMN03080618_02940 [Aquamicrobium aerolatum DSM 21857]